ncbi:MAG: diguanylate cyclase/phosphodiesterase with sensor(s) [Acidimicrobiia bacterium]|nr:diguanylate cyclase/phosphodiesterase with sensor(s) [Acidimicrobiia bacterium]
MVPIGRGKQCNGRGSGDEERHGMDPTGGRRSGAAMMSWSTPDPVERLWPSRSPPPREGSDLTAYVEMYRHSLDGILLTRPDGAVLAANPAACQILRSTEARLCSLGRDGIADPRDTRWVAAVEERRATGRARVQARMLRGDGSTVECDVASTIFEVPSGETQACVMFRDVSAATELLEALATSERRWRTTVDNAPVGIAVAGLDGVLLSVNKSLCAMLQYDEATLLTIAAQDLTHPADRPDNKDLLDRLRRGEIPWYHLEKRYLTSNGEVVPARVSVSLVRDDEGTPVHVVVQIQDIRAERQLIEELRASERRLTEAQETARVGSWDHNLRTGTVNWSRQMYQLHGVDESQPPSLRRFIENVHPAVRDVLITLISEARRTGERLDAAYRINIGSETRDIYALAEGVVGPDGEVVTLRGTAQDVTELRASERRAQELATTDPLTGLPNRALFADRLEQALALAARQEWEVAVLFVDLDRFKHVNDSLGHHRGDELLVEVAARITSVLRATDTVARLGGDEFAILLGGNASAAEAVQAADRVLSCFSASFVRGDVDHFASASIGVALWPEDCTTKAELLQHADLAMYKAKEAGGGCFAMFEPGMTVAAHAQLQLGSDLRRAIDGREFFLRYHPQVDLESGELRGVEALLRWQHPTQGEVAPAAFLPLLEETGLIVSIGSWVIDEACRQSARLRAMFPELGEVRMSVNIAPRQLVRPDLVGVVARALEASGTSPAELDLEITESSLIVDGGCAVANLRALRELGHRIAIDDFGTGYSSLAYLRRFPVDRLKIDKSFIDEVITGGPLVAATLHLADALGLDAVAEGVETEEQRQALVRLGCRQGQGYLWTVPLTAEELHAWVRQRTGSSAVPQ